MKHVKFINHIYILEFFGHLVADAIGWIGNWGMTTHNDKQQWIEVQRNNMISKESGPKGNWISAKTSRFCIKTILLLWHVQ